MESLEQAIVRAKRLVEHAEAVRAAAEPDSTVLTSGPVLSIDPQSTTGSAPPPDKTLPDGQTFVEQVAALAQQQDLAVEALRQALEQAGEDEIASAAREVRHLGASAPDLDWKTIYEIEQYVQDLDQFRSAILLKDDERIAVAWKTMDTRWSGRLHAPLDDQGRETFRRWGHTLRVRHGGRVGSNDAP